MSGLKVTATQSKYPLELSNSEIISHQVQIDDYKEELSSSLYETCLKYKPDLNLINQQPEIKQYLRTPLLQFLLKISIKTKVTNGIFYQAAKTFDRYCSKRIVLKDQAQLVLATCLWLSAKTYGGCNHIINNTNVPTGGRFYGPNPRARIPRLSELVILCNHSMDSGSGSALNNYDEGMFIQMERHILDTLNWDVVEPQLNNWLLNTYENNLIQLELNNNNALIKSKIELINLKRFLAEISLFEIKTIELSPPQLTMVILNILKKFKPEYQLSIDLILPKNLMSNININYYSNLIIDKILNSSDFILNYYLQFEGVDQFYTSILTSFIKSSDDQLQQPQVLKSSFSSSTTSSASIHKKPAIRQPLTPINSPTLNRNALPTPPSSKRNSPAIVFEKPLLTIVKSKPAIHSDTHSGFTPPLTPLE